MIPRRLLFFSTILCSLLVSMCDNSSPTRKERNNRIDPFFLIGGWVKVGVEEEWDYMENDVRNSGTSSEIFDDSSEIIIFLDDTCMYFAYNDDCYSFAEQPYSLSNDSLYGEFFSGSDGTKTRHTTLQLDKDSCIITTTEKTDEAFYTTVSTMKRFSGRVPLTRWPTERCDTGFTVKQHLPARVTPGVE